MPVVIHRLNDREHLFIVDFIVLLCRLELAAVEGDRVKEAIVGIPLGDDRTECEVGG